LPSRLKDSLDEIIPAVRAERAFWILGDDNGRLLMAVGRDQGGHDVPDPELAVAFPFIEKALVSGEPAEADGRPLISPSEGIVDFESRQIVCRPLRRGEDVLGLLCVQGFPRGPGFNSYDRGLLEILADQGAAALLTARILRESSRDSRLLVTGNLAAGVTHDFNNLLATIIGRAQDLLRMDPDPRMADALESIDKAARQGAEVVRRIEEVTHRGGTSRAGPRQLRGLVQDVVELTRFRWEGGALSRGYRNRVSIEIPEEIVIDESDGSFQEALTAMVLAGIDSLPEGGDLTIRGSLRGDEVEVLVDSLGARSNGTNRRVLLDPYGAVKGSADAGSGLSAACRLIRRIGGRVDVEEAPGRGTRIRFLVPSPEQVVSEADDAEIADVADVDGQRVLVVDDEEGVRELLRDLLGMADLDVDIAADGPTALEIFAKRPAQLVLTDLGMEPWTGWDVAEKVKALAPDTVVILITGWAGEVSEEIARVRQVDHVLSKPFDIDQVVSTVRRALAERANSA